MNRPAWVVRDVQPRSDYTLLRSFADGEQKLYDARPLLCKPIYAQLKNVGFFMRAKAECGTVVWNDDIDIDGEELWMNGVPAKTPFDGLLSFFDATSIWGLNESTLRKAINYGKLQPGIDALKFGKQWVVTRDAMIREYGQPT